jgi:hypothetical protein
MIFWEDLVKANVAADKDANDLAEAVHLRELEIKAGLIEELTGTEAQNQARIARAFLADATLLGLTARRIEAYSAHLDARGELDIASLRLNERLVEAHEANMQIAEKIHGS